MTTDDDAAKSDSNPDLHYEHIVANGLSFRVAVAGEGENLALCLHGCPELSYSWRHQLPVLAELGYRAWAPDLRGYGGTSRPDHVNDYAIEHLIEDVASLIDASGAASVTLIAHDWGGIIAWWFAIQQVRPLDRLIIMNLPHPAVVERALRRSPRQLLRSSYIALFQLPAIPERLLAANNADRIVRSFTDMAVNPERFTAADLEVYRQAALQPGALTAMLNYYRAYVARNGQRRMAKLGYPKIEIPVLLIWGDQDTALGSELTEGTEEYVTDLTLHHLPGASHWVQQDDPEAVNALLRSWLPGGAARLDSGTTGA